MHNGMICAKLTRMVILHQSIGNTAESVVTAALKIGYPTRDTASTPLRPLWVKCDRVNASARCNEKSTEMPTRMVSEMASTMPNSMPSATRMAMTHRMMATMLNKAAMETMMSPVKMTVANTANARDTMMDVAVPLMACNSVAMRTQHAAVTTPSADAFGGARSVEVTFPYESVTLYSNVIAEKSFKKSNHLLYSFSRRWDDC